MKTILALAVLFLPRPTLAQGGRYRPGAGITLQQFAEVSGSQSSDDFGYSVAVSGNTLVVGAPLAPDSICDNCGAAYVYTAVNGDWTNLTEVATLTPPADQGSIPGGFGAPVAIDGDTIAVGAATSTGANTYVYVNPSGNAAPTATLTTSVENGGEINGIAIDDSTIVVGMVSAVVVPHGEGAAFVYVEPSTGWADMNQTAALVSKDVVDQVTALGASVGMSGRNIVVGATEVKIGGLEQGAAYLFVEPSAGWKGTMLPTTKFEASNATRDAQFGRSVSVSGETVAVGAPFEAEGSSDAEGAVYMFTRPSSGWPKAMTETAELTASNPKAGSELGFSVALSGKTLAAGAPFARSGQGLVYLFTEPAGGWQTASSSEEISASDGEPGDYFGWSLAINGVMAVGATQLFGLSGGDGAAYIFGSQ